MTITTVGLIETSHTNMFAYSSWTQVAWENAVLGVEDCTPRKYYFEMAKHAIDGCLL